MDRITGLSQWERPNSFDISKKDEDKYDKARIILIKFYQKYNPEKIKNMNDILIIYYNKYTDLFISLANKYNVEDLSMFKGIDFD